MEFRRLRQRRRRVLWIFFLLGTLLLGCVAVYRFYLYWQPRHLVTSGRTLFAHGKDREAILAARRALQLTPSHAEAASLIADVAEKLDLREAVAWRQRASQSEPNALKNRLAWAASALRFGDLDAAEHALSDVPPAQESDAAYQAIAGTVAVAAGKLEEAEAHFSKAVAADPKNAMYRYNVAATRLRLSDSRSRPNRRAALEELIQEEGVATFALRALVQDSVAQDESREARKWSSQLVNRKDAIPTDLVVHLDLLSKTSDKQLDSFLAKVKSRATNDPKLTGEFITWMRNNQRTSEALAWAKTLPPQITASANAGPPLAACYIDVKDWAALDALLQDSRWQWKDYLRHALLAFSDRMQGNEADFRSHWKAAITAAIQSNTMAKHLAQLTVQWGWAEERRDVWKAAATSLDNSQWAIEPLYRYYEAEADTRGMQLMLQRLVELNSPDSAVRNNFAIYSLLLNTSLGRANDIARELYEKDPNSVVFASTYSYSLLRRGQQREALRLIEQLRPADLSRPDVSLYYGVILAANRQPEKALQHLKIAERAKLLPEERELLADTLGALNERAADQSRSAISATAPEQGAVEKP